MGSTSANATWTSDGRTRNGESSEDEERDDQGQDTKHENDGFLDATLPDNDWRTQDMADEAE